MLKLIRDQCGPLGTLGYIELTKLRIFTLERPWVPCVEGNPNSWLEGIPCGKKGVSCIPPGVYDLVPHSSEAHPNTWALVNSDLWVYHFDDQVPAARRGYARTAVLIHPANYPEELRGCIAPGMSRTSTYPTVSQSRTAFELLEPYLRKAPRMLEIIQS